ncbi:zinc knuckle (CCHC-type) family protein [Striga hermonthica]|uniref:Zinc knuckle (CCHC-type) family protein n=1 Tax=Striga hermonthica TaxID=68872 RepID=A0A9N7RQD0_STRHE|nr:zinc knuckle (CCHC-type) family protein [Striga hermonthica]
MSSASSSFPSPSNLLCYCGKRAQLRTSRTPSNPGKKFHGCKNWKDGGCTFFKWEDDPESSNNQILANEIIEGLVEQEQMEQGQVEQEQVEREQEQGHGHVE